MMNHHAALLAEAQTFLSEIFGRLEEANCPVSNFYLDHICYRTATLEEYLQAKRQLQKMGELLSANLHNGREISVFRLASPIEFKDRTINDFELPAPKLETDYSTGYEHIELVVDVPLRQLVSSHPHLNFNTKHIDQAENPSIKLNFRAGSVKFHRQALWEVLLK